MPPGIVILTGPALGPTLGGLLTDSLGWRWVFFINVPLGLLTVVMALAYLDAEDGSPRASRRVDWIGIALMATSLPLHWAHQAWGRRQPPFEG